MAQPGEPHEACFIATTASQQTAASEAPSIPPQPAAGACAPLPSYQIKPMPTTPGFSGLLCNIDQVAHDIRLRATFEAQRRSLGGETGTAGSLSMALYETVVPKAHEAARSLNTALGAYIVCLDERLFAFEKERVLAQAIEQDKPARLKAMAAVVAAEIRCQQACWTAFDALLHYGFLSHHAYQAFDEVLTLASPGLRSSRVVLTAARGFQRLLAERHENTLGTAALMLRSLTSHHYGAVTRDYRLKALGASEPHPGPPGDEIQGLRDSRDGLAHTMQASQRLQEIIGDLSIQRIRPFIVRADASMRKTGTFLPESTVADRQQAGFLTWGASASKARTGLEAQLDTIDKEWFAFLNTSPFERSQPHFAPRAQEVHRLMRLRRMLALAAFRTTLGYFFESCIHRNGRVKSSLAPLPPDGAATASRLIYAVVTESMQRQLQARWIARPRP